MRAFCLSLHADYLCLRSGTCCTSGWPIHVESDLLADWRDALVSGRLSCPEDGALPPLLRPGLLADRETCHAWEDLAVRTLGLDVAPEAALARIAALAERLRT